MPSIYDFDTDYTSEQLTPPLLRLPKRLAWLKTLLASLKKKNGYVFGSTMSFKAGFSVSTWSVLTAYVVGDRVRFGISVYEALLASTGVVPGSDSVTWLLIEKDFVGSDERLKYNSGKMLFEYVLNRYLNYSATSVPLIYITTNTIDTNGFYMGVDGDGQFGEMGVDTNQNDFLGTSYTLNQYAFTIYVPIALANTFTTETPNVAPAISTNRENIVRGVADKYRLAGILYNVVTY